MPRPPQGLHGLPGVRVTRAMARLVQRFAQKALLYGGSMLKDRSADNDSGKRYEIFCDALVDMVRRRQPSDFVRTNLQVCDAMRALIMRVIPAVRRAALAQGVRLEGMQAYASVALVRPGARAQVVHYDHYYAPERAYWTAFLKCSHGLRQGDTQFVAAGDGGPFYELPGHKIWSGRVAHRGGANAGGSTRYVLALAFARGEDPNRPFGGVPFRV